MEKLGVLLLVCLVCAQALCGCGQATKSAEVVSEQNQPKISVSTTDGATESSATMQSTTTPPTRPPRVVGPEQVEGNAVLLQNVSVAYCDQLPQSFKSSSSYSVCGFKEELILNESQVYAAIQFDVTNKTGTEMKIADIHDDFLVELVYDDQYVYSPDSGSWCFFQAGAKDALVSDMASLGVVYLAPLSSETVTVYIPCSRMVSENTEKNLSVVFSVNYDGLECHEFVIR